ncbi:MAG TPA: PAS domain S-box protein, partial [Gemmatimonadaceae bacterium]
MPTLADVLSESGALAVTGDPATGITSPVEAFDRLARLATALLGAPVAAITIVGPGEPRLMGVAGADRAAVERSDHGAAIGLCAQVLAGGAPIFVEDRRRHPHLAALWHARDPALLAYAGVPLLDVGGAPLGALGVADRRPRGWPEGERRALADLALVVVSEIERRVERVRHARATSALQRSETSLRVLYEQVAVGIGVTDAEGRFLQGNPFLCEMLGYAEDELRTLTRRDVTHPDERADMERRDARLLSGELRSYLVEKRFVRKDGAVVWGRAKISVTRDEALAPRRFITLVEDITERKRAEAERRQAARRLKVSEELHRSLFDHHPDAVALLDTEGRFLKANPAFEAITGYHPDEIVRQSFETLVMPDNLELAEAHFRAALAGEARTFEMPIRHRDGHQVEANITSIPVMVGDEVIGVFGIARDLAEQRALEAKLLHAQKVEVVGRLAGGVAHDFNNVLTIIQSYGELMRAELPVGSALREDVAEILRATGRGTALTRQLLAVGRRQAPRPRLLDLNEQLTGLAGMLRRLLGAHVSLETRLATDLWPVRMDAGQLEQVLINLVVNARDAMPHGGVITLRTANIEAAPAPDAGDEGAAPAQYVALVVEDTGVGIPPEVLPR